MSKGLKEIIPFLRCPITRKRLVVFEGSLIDQLNQKIVNKQLFFANKSPVEKSIKNGLITKDGKIIYLIKDGIILLLANLAIYVKPTKKMQNSVLNKSSVQEFYEQIGWKKSGDSFEDAVQFEDLRGVTKNYIHCCHKRLGSYLPKRGKFIVDIASGPIQYKEYLDYSCNFTYRVCIDFSMKALREAKKKLGNKGIYILGDITNIPLRDNAIDCVISLHTIYHVAASHQNKSFLEIHRILKPRSTAVIVYTWANPLLTIWLMSPINFFGKLKKIFYHKSNVKKNRLYFNPKSYLWFSRCKWPFKYQIYCWRSIDINVLKLYIHKCFFGKLLLKGLFTIENRFSNLLGRVGQYPIIVIQKNEKFN